MLKKWRTTHTFVPTYILRNQIINSNRENKMTFLFWAELNYPGDNNGENENSN